MSSGIADRGGKELYFRCALAGLLQLLAIPVTTHTYHTSHITHTLPPLSSGLDLTDFASTFQSGGGLDVGRRAFLIGRFVEPMQDSFTAIEKVVASHTAVPGSSLHHSAVPFPVSQASDCVHPFRVCGRRRGHDHSL